MADSYPNPLFVRFGTGHIRVRRFSDADGMGILLEMLDEPHPIGCGADMPEEIGVLPKSGEIYLHFTNIKSAVVLRDQINLLMCEIKSSPRFLGETILSAAPDAEKGDAK